MSEIVYKEESYAIIGKCMEVHNALGHGFSEVVYKDTLEFEFNEDAIHFEREKSIWFITKAVCLIESIMQTL